MLPFRTDTFDASNAKLIQLQRVQSGERVTWLYLCATVYQMNSERWLIVSGYDHSPSGPTHLAYPLPES